MERLFVFNGISEKDFIALYSRSGSAYEPFANCDHEAMNKGHCKSSSRMIS